MIYMILIIDDADADAGAGNNDAGYTDFST